MKTKAARLLAMLLTAAIAAPVVVRATDVDGPNDCTRILRDYGDAPEGTLAYPGVIGRFPSCLAATAAGTQESSCPRASTPPLSTGYVRHVSNAANPSYWLGCGIVGAGPMGIDSEQDAKVNSTGAGGSFCDPGVTVDCTETAFGLTFGQDECYGSTDAGLASPVTFTTCTSGTISFTTYSCAAAVRRVFLNILVDWSHDGDWNDAMQACNNCVPEWAVKNVAIDLPPGCFTQTSPAFLTGPTAGPAWMRVTISDAPVNDDFPWAGSATMPTGEIVGGETEDYPVTVAAPPTPCKTYRDFGDAPEGIAAYPSGIVGRFPTCLTPTAPGTPDQLCPDPSLIPPGPTGYVLHATSDTDNAGFWLGCGDVAAPLLGVDSEVDGKSWLVFAAGQIAACDPHSLPDCNEPAFGGMTFGQDECYGDADAGLTSFVSFAACSTSTVTMKTYACGSVPVHAYLNILVDWNQDGDWNDVVRCEAINQCVPEWAVRDQPVTLPIGCSFLTSPPFLAGPTPGPGWMRITLSEQPAPPDFPWNGSVSLAGAAFTRGETEDYPIQIVPSLVGVGDSPPQRLAFAPPAPNPATHGCSFTFTLPHDDEVSLVVYDIAGRERARVLAGRWGAGMHTVPWDFHGADGTELRAGMYMVRLRVGSMTLTRSVLHVR
ncbi:MAG TPA: GEVED domain-containing protein [Candidatus Eisenbacteria bacterium]|jgi:hypothetical protein